MRSTFTPSDRYTFSRRASWDCQRTCASSAGPGGVPLAAAGVPILSLLRLNRNRRDYAETTALDGRSCLRTSLPVLTAVACGCAKMQKIGVSVCMYVTISQFGLCRDCADKKMSVTSVTALKVSTLAGHTAGVYTHHI